MKGRHVVLLPQMGANDEYATVVNWHKRPGDEVKAGDILCSVETSKAVYDVEADASGYLVPLAREGAEVKVGAPLAVLTAELEDVHEIVDWVKREIAVSPEPRREAAYTKKALIVAGRMGVDIEQVTPSGERVTEADVLTYCKEKGISEERGGIPGVSEVKNRTERILIIGGGDGAVQLIDVIVTRPAQEAVAIFDDDQALHGTEVMGVPVIGPVSIEKSLEMHREGRFDAAIISVSTSIEFRERIFNLWRDAGIPFTNVVHPSVFIGRNVSMGAGNVVLAFCHIGAYARVGSNNFLSAYANIEHHTVLGDHCSFGPGIFTSSSVRIGDRVRMGTGIYIEPHLSVGSGSVIASGAVLVNHVRPDSVVKARPHYSIRRKTSSR